MGAILTLSQGTVFRDHELERVPVLALRLPLHVRDAVEEV